MMNLQRHIKMPTLNKKLPNKIPKVSNLNRKMNRFVYFNRKIYKSSAIFNKPIARSFCYIPKKMTGGEIIYQKLLQHNVKDVFMYSGGAIMPVIDAFYKGEINYYINTHEQNTGHSATGYAKSSGKTGIAIVTSGPALTNMITPILDANNDSTPMIVFSGQVPRSAMGTLAFQEAPSVDITKPITKWSYCLDNIDEISEVIDKAFYIANDGKKGVVHIDVPKDISAGTIVIENSKLKNTFYHQQKQLINDDKMNKIADIINNAEKPVLYVGQGCNRAYQSLRKLATIANIPVTTTLHALGVVDERSHLSLRMCGMHGNPVANFALQEADCIIAIGSRFDDRTTGAIEKYAPVAVEAKQIIHCNIEESEIGKVIKPDYSFQADSMVFLQHLMHKVDNVKRGEWFNRLQYLKTKHPISIIENGNLKAQHVLEELNKLVEYRDNIIFTTGVGNHQMYATQFLRWNLPNRLITSGSAGVMGAGLPYAIGAQIANPDKQVILIDGDGSFNMTLSDLKTIREYNLRVKIIVLNNSSQDMVRVWEKLFYDKRHIATKNEYNPDYVALANSFDINAIYCDKKVDVKNKLRYFLRYPNSILCEFKVSPDICLPLVGPGKALDEMVLTPDDIDINKELPPS
jgi:acetolactate synthase-1/2/3 large subunit